MHSSLGPPRSRYIPLSPFYTPFMIYVGLVLSFWGYQSDGMMAVEELGTYVRIATLDRRVVPSHDR